MCNFIPEYIFRNIIANGNAEEQRMARKSLMAIQRFQYDPLTLFRQHQANMMSSGDVEVSSNKSREIYDAENRNERLYKLVLKEGGQVPNDTAVKDAYDGAGHTYDFYKKFFDRNSIDGNGKILQSTVHYGVKFNNAFWDGNSMTFGDGDGKIFTNFSSCLDVNSHELAHGITETSAGLIYYSQSGALNEHFSDVAGSMVKQWVRNQTADKADWIIGEGLFTKEINGVGIRSMKNPGSAFDDPRLGKDPQPKHMKDYYDGEDDNQGVHINSSVPNLAFYIACMNIGGYSWEKMGKVWYSVLTERMKPKSNFQDFANATVKVASKMYGKKSIECKAVIDGLHQVGLKPSRLFSL